MAPGPNLHRTQPNGHGMATAEWFVLDQLAATRSFSYLILPTEVIKGSQVDIEEDGVSGGSTSRPAIRSTRPPPRSPARCRVCTELADSTDPQVATRWMKRASSIRPKVTRLALQNVASVAGLLLTTEIKIAEAPKRRSAEGRRTCPRVRRAAWTEWTRKEPQARYDLTFTVDW